MVLLEPYATEARWHRIFLESDGSETKITSSDIDCGLDGTNWLLFPMGFHVLDFKVDFNTIAAASGANRVNDFRFTAEGDQEIYLPPAANYDWGFVYVLGYIKE